MIEIDFEPLRSIGLSAEAVRNLQQMDDPAHGASVAMRVTEVHRETVQVHDGHGEHVARPLPGLRRRLAEEDDTIACGDWVLVRRDAHGDPWIAAAAVPVTRISRRDGDGHRHTVVTNVDTVFIVMGLDGDFNPRRVERYIALLHGTGAWPVLVLTKRDVAAPSEEMLALRLAELWGRVPPTTDVIAVDATSPEAAQSLAPYCAPGQTIVLLGSSGAGKSTLTNALLGHATQDTGRVRSHDSRGKHTTTSRSLHRLPSGACVIDTPGVRTLRPDSDEATVSASFGDIEALAHRCRFRDCTHRNEPGCAVRDAIDADRLRNYHKLLREMRRDTLNPLDRRAALARWKAMARAGAARARAKRGE